MAIKVGDIVEYKGEIVRLMAVYSRSLGLSRIGRVFDDMSKLKLIESVDLPDIETGDFVMIHDIPYEEKEAYAFYWGSGRESCATSSQSYKVLGVCHDENYGTCINIDGLWICPYHVEKVSHYDII